MRVRAASLLLCLLGWPVLAPADAVRDAVTACIGAVDAFTASRVVKEGEDNSVDVAKVCPDLRPAVEDSAYGPWLTREWWENLKRREQLVALDRLLGDASRVQPTASPDTSRVSSVLEGLRTEESQRKLSTWERFVRWLYARLQKEDEGRPLWLEEWLKKVNVPESSARTISRVIMGLIVLAALLAILNELRAAGVFGQKYRRVKPQAPASAGMASTGPLSLEQIEASTLRLQPSLLLELLLSMMSREQKAAGNRSLTHREVSAAVSVPGEQHRHEFDDLVGCAERTRYAGVEPTNEELSGAVASGRRLLEAVGGRVVAGQSHPERGRS